MAGLTLDITMSLDGFVAGPNPSLDEPLGQGGERLHEWIVRLASWREYHGLEGGETGADDELAEEIVASIGAHIMGRRMFSSGAGPWEQDPKADGWWGNDPPFHHRVFVLTRHAREPLVKEGGTTFHFVTDGIESALEQAKAAAGGLDVGISGGADVAQQYLAAGLIDTMHIHIAPLLLGGGTRLFDEPGGEPIKLEPVRAVQGRDVVHLTFARPS
ncbi:MAG TPA: dihydrofolate reductase family protein [Gaiellaceae bacterium]|jgi:dihydrofolate reductase|nr:dihydrofolate reductase family protein [Gaiellaceae bacterium]